jgi:hypothetical protein
MRLLDQIDAGEAVAGSRRNLSRNCLIMMAGLDIGLDAKRHRGNEKINMA